MSWHPSQTAFPRIILFLGSVVFSGFVSQSSLVAEPSSSGSAAGPEVECITPDGRESAVSTVQIVDPKAAASIIDGATLSCPLREGNTTFIIALPKNMPRDRFTFVNENAAACGDLTIAVSNSRLTADSPDWTEVDGIIPFSHKRLFNLSMLGVETRFVRLSFHVESTSGDLPDRRIARVSISSWSPALFNAIDSHHLIARARGADIAASFGSLSASPFSSAPDNWLSILIDPN